VIVATPEPDGKPAEDDEHPVMEKAMSEPRQTPTNFTLSWCRKRLLLAFFGRLINSETEPGGSVAAGQAGRRSWALGSCQPRQVWRTVLLETKDPESEGRHMAPRHSKSHSNPPNGSQLEPTPVGADEGTT
jgi:hypothetical protein